MSLSRTSYEDDEKRSDSLDLGGKGLQKSDSEIEKEGGNLVMEVEDAAALGLKTAADGKVSRADPLRDARCAHERSFSLRQTILVPQPSDDPKDPLNWSATKKGLILAILALAAFGGDFQSGAGIPLLESQGEEWGMSPTAVNRAGNLNVLFLGIGGLIWIPPLYFWGRLPVLFWTQFIGTFFVLGSALAPSFEVYYVLRPLTSLFLTAGQTIGLTFIHDIFYKHLWAKKIGIWVAIFLGESTVPR